jgi:hypothetical protein
MMVITVSDGKRSDVSSPIRSVKMYSYSMLNVLCKREQYVVPVEMYPAWPIWSRNLASSTLSTYPSPYLPG